MFAKRSLHVKLVRDVEEAKSNYDSAYEEVKFQARAKFIRNITEEAVVYAAYTFVAAFAAVSTVSLIKEISIITAKAKIN